MPYQIQSGDTLSGIAKTNNTSVQNLLSLNPDITDPNKIQAGANLNLPTSNIVPVDSLKESNPINIPTLPADTTNPQGIIAGSTADLKAKYEAAQKAADDAQKALSDTSTTDSTASQILSLMGQESQKTADTQAAMDASGATAIAKQLSQLNTQAQNLNLEAQAIPIQTQERNANTGATDVGVAPQNAGALRMNALKALSLSQQANIAIGNYTAAKDTAQRIIDLKYQPIENQLSILKQQYDFNKDFLQSVDKKAANALNDYLNQQARELADAKEIAKSNADKASDYVKYAMEAGQSDIASQISSLDVSSKTFTQDLASLQAKIKNPMMALDLAIKQQQLATAQRAFSLMDQPSASELKAEAQALKTAQGIIPVMQDKITLIDSLKSSAGLKARVGTSILSRQPQGVFGTIGKALTGVGLFELPFDAYSKISGEGQQFAGGVHRLASQEFIDTLINAKANGATFGALTDREGDALRAAATQINDWEIKDKNGIGKGIWNIDEKSFKDELDRIKLLAQKAISVSSSNLLNSEEQSLLDDAFEESQSVSSFYGE